MHKLVFVFSVFSLVSSSTVPTRNVGQRNLSEDNTKASPAFITKTSADGTPLQKCQCRAFHGCDRNDVYDPSLNQDWIRCDNQVHVCCILKGEEFSGLNASISAPDNTSPPKNVPLGDSSGQLVDEEKKTNDTDTCTCVSFAMCSDEGYITSYGQGIVGVSVRVNPCHTSEVCCPNEYLKKTAEDIKPVIPPASNESEKMKPSPTPIPLEQSTEPIIPPVTSSAPSPVEASSIPVRSVTLVPDDAEQVYIPAQDPQSQCSCVPFDSCKNDSVTSNHGAGLLQLRAPLCDVTEVCCLVSDVIAASAPISSEKTAIGNSTNTSSELECGVRRRITPNSSAVDQSHTDFGEFPFMILIMTKDAETGKLEMICGGSLVSFNMVLTAAHCVHKVAQEKLIIRAGEYDYKLDGSHEEQPHQDRTVYDIRIHPFYREGVVFNDMALLITDEAFEMKSHVSPICLPFVNSKFADPNIYDPNKCIATGWGKEIHGDSGSLQNSLKQVDLSLMDHHECEKRLRESKLGPKFLLHSSFICAGGEIGKDTCQGDGGGPLFCALREKPDRYVQVGITSWGLDCGQQLPGVYTNVKANAKWLTVEINMSTIFARNTENEPRSKSQRRS